MATPPFDIPENNIHIIEEQEWPDKKLAGGHHELLQNIEIREQAQKIVLASLLFHEMLHFKSYNTAELKNGKIESFRSGLKSHDRPEGRELFVFMNEAVVSELQKRFNSSISDNPLFADEVAITTETLNKHINLQNSEGIYYAKENLQDGTITTANMEHYKNERTILWKLLDKILQKNPKKFNNSEEVFYIFVSGLFAPTLITVGKLIDETFGVGTYRKISEAGHDLTQVQMLVESL